MASGNTHLLALSFHAKVQAWCDWVLCSGSHEAKIKVLAWLCSYLPLYEKQNQREWLDALHDPSHLALSFDSLVDIIIKCFSYIIVSSTNESTFYDQQVIIIAYS